LSIELENIDKSQLSKDGGLNTVKVASTTLGVGRVNPNAVSVRNSNTALDYRPPEELKQQPFIPHPADLFGKQVYGHS
jgi:hypothetical protein